MLPLSSWSSNPRLPFLFYVFFWVIPRRLNIISRRFGTLCSIFIGGQMYPIRLWRWNRQSVPKSPHIKFRRLGITQKKAHNIQNGESLKSRTLPFLYAPSTMTCVSYISLVITKQQSANICIREESAGLCLGLRCSPTASYRLYVV